MKMTDSGSPGTSQDVFQLNRFADFSWVCAPWFEDSPCSLMHLILQRLGAFSPNLCKMKGLNLEDQLWGSFPLPETADLGTRCISHTYKLPRDENILIRIYLITCSTQTASLSLVSVFHSFEERPSQDLVFHHSLPSFEFGGKAYSERHTAKNCSVLQGNFGNRWMAVEADSSKELTSVSRWNSHQRLNPADLSASSFGIVEASVCPHLLGPV